MKLRVGGLHLQLLGLVILPFSLILLTVALVGIRIHQTAMRQLVAERDVRSARAAAAAISEQLHHRESAIRDLALRLQDGASPQDVLDNAWYLWPDFDGGLAITDVEGGILASSAAAEAWRGRPLQPLIQGLSPGQAGFSDPFSDQGQTMVMIIGRAENGAAVGGYSLRLLLRAAMLEAVVASGNSSAFLVDRAGNLLESVGPAPEPGNLLEHPGVQAGLRGEIGSLYLPSEDGEHVVAFAQVQPTGWALIVDEPWESVVSPVLEVSLAAPLVLVPGLFVTLVALWFGARQVIGPLRKLQQQAEELARSNYGVLGDPVGGIAEIQQLQEELVEMATGIRAAHQALESYIGSITLAQEDERERLARDLHDSTIQDLIALDHRVQMIQTELEPRDPGVATRLAHMRREINRSIQELRRLTGALRPIYLEDLGLVPALEMLAKDAEQDLGIRVSFDVEGQARRLGPDAELAIFRIVQEALRNISRHADASKASLRLAFSEGTVTAEIQDDGQGFEPPGRVTVMASQGHYGLLGMHERAQLVGARLRLESAPRKGTRVIVVLPLPG
ncbi:MAG: histidine kinase [Chloroflexota bacterium]